MTTIGVKCRRRVSAKPKAPSAIDRTVDHHTRFEPHESALGLVEAVLFCPGRAQPLDCAGVFSILEPNVGLLSDRNT